MFRKTMSGHPTMYRSKMGPIVGFPGCFANIYRSPNLTGATAPVQTPEHMRQALAHTDAGQRDVCGYRAKGHCRGMVAALEHEAIAV